MTPVVLAMLIETVLFFLAILLAWYLVFWYRRRNFYKLASKLPELEGLSFLGIVLKFVGVKCAGMCF